MILETVQLLIGALSKGARAVQKPLRRRLVAGVCAAMLASSADAAILGFEAEDGSSFTTTVTATLGGDLDPPLGDAGALGGQYITAETDFLSPTSAPQSADKVASYSIAFAEAGTYDLYGRIYIGPGGADDAATPGPGNDDSFFYGSGFGAKDPTNGGDWITANGLPENGVPSEQYVWVNLSLETGQFGEAGATFTVAAPGAETFEFGTREDGLRMDAFAFGTTGETFSDGQLNQAVTGVPEPASMALMTLSALAVLRRRR